jgi:hypothetical protein
MRIMSRDASKIPKEWLFCIDKKLYKIAITVEDSEQEKGLRVDQDDKEQWDRGEDKHNFDDVDDLDEEDNTGGGSHTRADNQGCRMLEGQHVGSGGFQGQHRCGLGD